MTLQFTPIVLLYFISFVITLFLAYQTWKMRPARGASYWAFTMLFSAIFALGAGVEIVFADPLSKYAMLSVIYFGVTGIMFSWALFCISYSHHQKWLNRYTITLLLLIPLTTFFLILTLDKHQLMYRDYEFITQDGLVLSSVVEYGSFFWVWVAYSYLSLILGSIILIHSAIRYSNIFQGQAGTVVISVLIPTIASIFYIFGFNPIAPFDLTPITLAISGVVMFYGMKRYRFLEITPIAYDLVFNNVASAVIIIDLEGRIINMNTVAESTFNQTRNKVVGMRIQDAFPQYYELQSRFRNIMDITTEISIDKANYELRITPLNNRHGKLAGRIIMLYDISERLQMKKQEIELSFERERLEILRKFISDVSHDLKTPLTIMKTSQYLLRRELGDTNSKHLDKLGTQTNHLVKLVEDMLLMLRLDDENDTDLQKTNVNDLLHHAIEEYPESNKPRIQFFPLQGDCYIQASRTELLQALSNILNNAIYNTPPDGEITIYTDKKDGNLLQIRIHDTSIGITEEDLPYIFDSFYRVDKARNSEIGSSGLGLAISKRILERHKGTIEVSSTQGEGSEFRMMLPLSN